MKKHLFRDSNSSEESPFSWNVHAVLRIVPILQVTSQTAGVPWRSYGITRRFCFGGWFPEGPQNGRRLPRHHRDRVKCARDIHAVDPRRCYASRVRDKRGTRQLIFLVLLSRWDWKHLSYTGNGHPRGGFQRVDG